MPVINPALSLSDRMKADWTPAYLINEVETGANGRTSALLEVNGVALIQEVIGDNGAVGILISLVFLTALDMTLDDLTPGEAFIIASGREE